MLEVVLHLPSVNGKTEFGKVVWVRILCSLIALFM